MLHAKYQGSMVSDKKFFYVLPIQADVRHVTTGAWPFRPQGHNLNTFGKSLLGDTTYQILRLKALWFQNFFFLRFAYIRLRILPPGAAPV